MQKIKRNDSCFCGSDLKYKKCCQERHENAIKFRANNNFTSDLDQAHMQINNNNYELAEQICLQILQQNPFIDEALYLLANIAYKAGKKEAALTLIKKAISYYPARINDYFYSIANIYIEHNELNEALHYYHLIIKYDNKHGMAYAGLGNIYIKKNDFDNAKKYYSLAAKYCPNDEKITYLNNSFQGRFVDAAPVEYIKDLFDQYADHFEEHLQTQLGYEVPKLAANYIKELINDEEKTVLDLGCGTGISAIEMGKLSIKANFTGIDLSTKMLDEAKKKNLYNKLYQVEIKEFLQNYDSKFDIILAFDLFIYIGNLNQIFALIKKILTEKGIFALSIEENFDCKDYILQRNTARYAQSMSYIMRLAEENSLSIIKNDKLYIRKGEVDGIKGRLIILQN
jgi:predicted TPR repeat methyltransferase